MQSRPNDPQTELIASAHALENRAAYFAWPDYSVVRVRGEDRLGWLNGQLTNDVRQIPEGGSVHALAVNVRGKILAETWVFEDAANESLLLIIPSGIQAALLENLERYIIMEDVELSADPALHVLGLEGPLAQAVAAQLTAADVVVRSWSPLGLGGPVWIGEDAALAAITAQLAADPQTPSVSREAYDLVRLRRAVPRYGVDYTEQHYPQEAGLKDLVSFKKGCYLGQEVVCTLENRGRLSRHLCVLRGASPQLPAAGSGLHLEGAAAAEEPVGTITSAMWDPERSEHHVLGYVRRIHANQGAVFSAGGHSLTLIDSVGGAL